MYRARDSTILIGYFKSSFSHRAHARACMTSDLQSTVMIIIALKGVVCNIVLRLEHTCCDESVYAIG